jgi:uncharacterized OB-fold protein
VTEPERPEGYGDPLTRPFWEAASRRELVLQRCAECGHHELFPRPFCVRCGSDRVEWVRAAGTGTVYSTTIVRIEISPDFEPPYSVALVDLDEGPRMLGLVDGEACAIGDPVGVAWRDREGGPPVPVFRPTTEE